MRLFVEWWDRPPQVYILYIPNTTPPTPTSPHTQNSYDVLFQDADLVWFKAPWPVFDDPGVDGYFMDDGARSERFAPLFANSGFYYLRATPMVQHFMQTVMFRSACVLCVDVSSPIC